MFEDDIILDICRYEVGIIINDNRESIPTNDLETANNYYEAAVEKYAPDNTVNHVIVFLYDYDKNTNINYFDNAVDIF